MGNNSVPKFIFRLSRFPVYRGSVLGRFYCINNQKVPYANTAKYLGMTLDAKFQWKAYVKKKRVELGLRYKKIYWLI
jgi:hypothetical protein